MKKTSNKSVTPQQVKAIHASCRNVDEETKRGLIHEFSNGRTTSSKELTFDEARQLIDAMRADQQATDLQVKAMMQKEAINLLRSIYTLSFEISFLNAGFTDDTPEDRGMNQAKINKFCVDKSIYRKPITQMSVEELTNIKKQFEAIARKESKKNESNK